MKSLAFVFAVLLGFSTFLAAGEIRTWTDNQGRKVKAEMLAFRQNQVLLKLESGKQITFPFAQLSEADRGYVRENAPIDPRTATAQIDQMILDKLKASYAQNLEAQAKLRDDAKMSREAKAKELKKLQFQKQMLLPTKRTTDEQFVRRVYLDIAGRIPTYSEANAFLLNRDKAKRAKLIDELLYSEAFVSHFFNYFSDLLRVRDGISMGGIGELKSAAYAEWIKEQIRANRPWDEMVTDMLVAKGYYWDNPATGYLLTDYGMELCNLSNTFTVFTGTEITCAQCHDHPFEEVYQMDFYRMAAFFGNLEFNRQADPAAKSALDAKRKELAAQAKKEKKDIRAFDAVANGFNWCLGDGPANKIKLPFDYKYDDGEPNEPVQPATYFGSVMEVEKFDSPRHAFAQWMVSKDNPRFTINIANRMWSHVFGLGQIEPVDNIPGHLDGQAQNYELLKFLEQLMKELDYNLKAFLGILYKTQAYQREASYHSPTLTMIDKGEYHFPAPIMRRMSAEQLWDSFVALSVAEPESLRRGSVLEDYRSVMQADWASLNMESAMQLAKAYEQIGKGDGMMAQNNRRGRGAPAILRRASELPLPNGVGSFLYTFGQSDKAFIENSTRVGTIPQVMMLLNGELTNKLLSNEDRAVIQQAKSARSKNDAIDVCFLSILGRRANHLDRDFAEMLVKGGENPAASDFSDLIWALLNLHEFMFIQ